MAKIYTGKDGAMYLDGTVLAKVQNFSIQADLETLPTTSLSEQTRSYCAGLLGYSGSATLLYYKDDNNSINVTNLLNKVYRGVDSLATEIPTVQLEFRWIEDKDIDGNPKTKFVKMNAYITSATIGASTGDISRAQISFQATGDLVDVRIGG